MDVLQKPTLNKLWTKGFFQFGEKLTRLSNRIPQDFSLFLSRFAIASVFWRSVQTKIDGWEFLGQSWQFFNVTPSAVMLFQYEYDLPFIAPGFAAHLATLTEFFLPILLVIGLGTRFAALGLFLVTCVIQFLVFPNAWPTHILWFAILIYVMRNGAGRFSMDYFIKKNAQ